MSVLKLKKAGAGQPMTGMPDMGPGVIGLPSALPAFNPAMLRPKKPMHPAAMKTLKIKAKQRLKAL